MTLNISAEQKNGGPRSERQALADELLEELTANGPRDHLGAFKRWHRGSLSLVHLTVVATLQAEGPLSMSHLAEELGVSVASATGIISRMEARGLVTRSHDAKDRRIVLVHGTGQGAEMFRDLGAQRRARLARLLAELTEDELAGFLAGLRGLRAARTRLRAAGDGAADGLSTLVEDEAATAGIGR